MRPRTDEKSAASSLARRPSSASPRVAAASRSRRRDHRLALVTDPRFPGGTSAALAAEIRALGGEFDVSINAIETTMFKGRTPHPAIAAAAEEEGLSIHWNPPVVHADTVVFHNPSCLRFDRSLATRFSCTDAFVVTHENFLRPTGAEGFDVAACLALIEASLVCGRRRLAPVSSHNRRTVEAWLAGASSAWTLTRHDWFNVLDLEMKPPNPRPRDRRGRHSRPGLEKFPSLDAMKAHFPPHAERCAILGGDAILNGSEPAPAHWDVRRFGEVDVSAFLSTIDFFVYFTSPSWRESFGRVVAEAIAAGKLVITDPGTAAPFGAGAVGVRESEVDGVIRAFCADPRHYVAAVEAAQAELRQFGAAAFLRRVRDQIDDLEAAGDDLV